MDEKQILSLIYERKLEQIDTKIGIYCFIYLPTKKWYVGSSIDIRKRWKEHKSSLRTGKHSSWKLNMDFKRYNAGDFDFIILEKCSKENLLNREQYWLDTLQAVKFGYNIQEKANKTEHSQETINKLRKTNKERNIKPGQKCYEALNELRRKCKIEKDKIDLIKQKIQYDYDKKIYGNYSEEKIRKIKNSESRRGHKLSNIEIYNLLTPKNKKIVLQKKEIIKQRLNYISNEMKQKMKENQINKKLQNKDLIEKIAKIKGELLNKEKTNVMLAAEYGVSRVTIDRISNKQTYSYVKAIPMKKSLSDEFIEKLKKESNNLPRKRLIQKYPDIPIGFINQLYYKTRAKTNI